MFAKSTRLLYNLYVNGFCLITGDIMKHDEKSDVLKKIEEAVESTKKRMYEIKKENNPNLDWNIFSKKFDSMKDSADMSLKDKLFREEIDKIIENEMDLENKILLNSFKEIIGFQIVDISKESKIKKFITKVALMLAHYFTFYFISVIVFGLFSYNLVVPIWYIFLLSLITSTLFMLCDMPTGKIKAFIFDPFFKYKLLITYILIMFFINEAFYKIFEASAIWIFYIVISTILHDISARNIHKLWWRF